MADRGVRDAFLKQLEEQEYHITLFADGSSSIVQAFGLRPNLADVESLLAPVLDAMTRTTDSYQLRFLARAVAELSPRL